MTLWAEGEKTQFYGRIRRDINGVKRVLKGLKFAKTLERESKKEKLSRGLGEGYAKTSTPYPLTL